MTDSLTPAALAVDLIIEDLTDRAGLSGVWDSLDFEAVIDIKTAWIGAIQSAYGFKALTVDEVERIILATEPAELSDRGDRIWTRRMAVALADLFNARSKGAA